MDNRAALRALQLQSRDKKDLPDLANVAPCRIREGEFRKSDPDSLPRWGELSLRPDEVAQGHPNLVWQYVNTWICCKDALDVKGYPALVEVIICGRDVLVGGREHHLDFFRESSRLLKCDPAFDLAIERCKSRAMRNVYIPAMTSHPLGLFRHELSDKVRVQALLASFFGIRNPLMCSNCIRFFTSNTGWNDVHFLWPFHCCISMQGLMKGKCSNCIWRNKDDCEWEELSMYQAADGSRLPLRFPLGGRATIDVEPATYSVDRLNPSTCPRVTPYWPARLYGWEDGEVKAFADDQRRQVLRHQPASTPTNIDAMPDGSSSQPFRRKRVDPSLLGGAANLLESSDSSSESESEPSDGEDVKMKDRTGTPPRHRQDHRPFNAKGNDGPGEPESSDSSSSAESSSSSDSEDLYGDDAAGEPALDRSVSRPNQRDDELGRDEIGKFDGYRSNKTKDDKEGEQEEDKDVGKHKDDEEDEYVQEEEEDDTDEYKDDSSESEEL